MKSNKILFYAAGILSVIWLIIALICHKTKIANIETNGISAIGTVIELSQTRNKGRISVGIKFDFYANDSILVVNRSNPSNKYFSDAIIGMKYKVMYLHEKPHINSRLNTQN